DPSNFYTPFAVDPSRAGHVVLGTDRVWETFDRGDDWTAIGTPGQNGWPQLFDAFGNPIITPATGVPVFNNIDTMAIAPTNSSTIYAEAGGFILATTNDGAAWNAVAFPGGNVSDMVVDPGISQTVYATVGSFTGALAGTPSGHVFRSTDGGQTWNDISGNLPDVPVNTIVIDGQDGSMYIGTDNGVYACNDTSGSFWYPFQSGLPNVRVSD